MARGKHERRGGRYGVFTPLEILFNPTPDPACRDEFGLRAKGGGKPANGQVVNSVGLCCPVTPKNSGPQGGLAIKGEATTSGLEFKRGRLGGT